MTDQHGDETLPLAVLKHVDETRDRFESALLSGQRPLIEDYLADIDEPSRKALLRELVILEAEYLSRGGKDTSVESYCSRFPDAEQVIRDALADKTTGQGQGHSLSLAGNVREGSNIETKRLGMDDGTQACQVLTHAVEKFQAAWQRGGEPPDMADYLPAEPDALRRMVLFELIKVDLFERWEHGGPENRRTLEDYAALFADAAGEAGLPFDVVYEEYRIRKKCGDDITLVQYADRFPQYASALQHCVGDGSSPMESTMMVGRAAVSLDMKGQIDDFEIKEQIGKGAFATVFLARQRSIDRIVALKISSQGSDEPKTMAQLDHPNIIRIFDQRWLADRGMWLLYMEYAPGGTLMSVVQNIRQTPETAQCGDVLLDAVDESLNRRDAAPQGSSARRRIGDMTWPQTVCHLGSQLASALQYAHDKGILHRDIKPANILLRADATPKLADFNISYGSQIVGATPTAYFGGSLAYMSPEQLQACHPECACTPAELDGRSDIYSLGLVLYELLVGRRPFTDVEIDGNWLATLSKSIQQRDRGVDNSAREELVRKYPGMAQILLKCLASKPEDRYESADKLRRQFELQAAPNVQALLRPPVGSWRHWVVQWPLLTLSLAVLLPNIVLSALNLFYNISEIIGPAPKPQQEAFYQSLTPVNAVAWGLATVFCLYHFWPVYTGLKDVRAESRIAADRWIDLGRRTLGIGSFAAIIVFGSWLASGIAFPLAMGSRASDHTVDSSSYMHFAVSQAIHGLIVAALSFFFVTFLTVRAIYPRFIPESITQSGIEADLNKLRRRVGHYATVLGITPLLAILALGLTGSEQSYFVLLALLGGLAFLVAIGLKPLIQSDLDHLRPAVRPADESLAYSSDMQS